MRRARTIDLDLNVNGERRRVVAEPTHTLLDVLRDELFLTGTKRGCDQGVCGSCTVLSDGMPVRSCLVLAAMATGCRIATIEAQDEVLEIVRASFVASGAVQCGFCIPGMIISATALLRENSSPELGEIRDAIAGQLCRCTGYAKIIDAIALAARRLRTTRAQ